MGSADAQLRALRKNIPNYINEDVVNEYATGKHLFDKLSLPDSG